MIIFVSCALTGWNRTDDIVCLCLFLDENVDDSFNYDPDADHSSLSDVEKLDRIIQSDQYFIRCVTSYQIVYYIYIKLYSIL